MKAKTEEKSAKIRGKKRSRKPIEYELNIEDFVSFDCISGTPGACLLSKKGKEHQFRFAFEITTLNPTMGEVTMEATITRLENALKALPGSETLTIVQETRPNNSERLDYYKRLLAGAPNRLFAEMVKSAASPGSYFVNLSDREKRNRAKSKYKSKTTTLYVTVTPSSLVRQTRSEKIATNAASTFRSAWESFTGNVTTDAPSKIKNLFKEAVIGFENWKNILSQIGVNFRALTFEEIALRQWEEFNTTEMTTIPQVITWDGELLSYNATDDTHISSWIFSDARSVPRAHRDFVYQEHPNGDLFTGIVTLRDKPAGWANVSDALLYLHGKTEHLHNYKIVTTLTKGSIGLAQRSVEVQQRQAIDAITAAQKRNLPTTTSQQIQSDADEAAANLYSGNVPIKMSICIVIREGSYDDLMTACRRTEAQFPLPAKFVMELDYTYTTWFQCMTGMVYERPLFKPYDRSKSFFCSNIPPFMPLFGSRSVDKEGLEFHVDGELVPYYIDIINGKLRHMLFIAITRGGKSVLFAQILLLTMCSDVPMVVVDYPREDGDSTFGPITHLAGKNGAYLNILEESNNFLEPPDLSAIDDDSIGDRITAVQDYALDILMIIVFGASSGPDDREKRTAKLILVKVLTRFYEDPDIAYRFKLSAADEIGGPDWANQPTLHDLTELCTVDTIQQVMLDVAEEHVQAVGEIRLALSAFMDTTVGRSMSSPTTISRDANLIVFAFASIKNNDDAAVLMASASAAAMRRTLSAPKSILFLDEATILSEFPALLAQAARISANGGKSGIRLMMALQTPSSLNKSVYGQALIANMATKFIGRLDEADLGSYEAMKLDAETLSRNTMASFEPNFSELYSNWLIVDCGRRAFVRSYAPPMLLAAVANNQEEERAKEGFIEYYKGDIVAALREFAKEIIASNDENRPLSWPVHSDKVVSIGSQNVA